MGCAHYTSTAAIPVVLPDNAPGAVINCQRRSQCYELGSRMCNGPYAVLMAHDDTSVHDFSSGDLWVEYVIRCLPKEDNAHAQQ